MEFRVLPVNCSSVILTLIWLAAGCRPGAQPGAPNPRPPRAAVHRSTPIQPPPTAVWEEVAEPTTCTAETSVPAQAAEAGAPRTEKSPRAAKTGSEPPPLPSGSRVLHIGDSFAGALGYRLNHHLRQAGVHGILKYEKSTYIPTWAWSKALGGYLRDYQPDLVLITLGANELEIGEPQKRAATVRRLVDRLGGRACVWIGIPLWKGADPKLMQVVRANVAPCLFLDSTQLVPEMSRSRDGIHPSKSARDEWATRVIRWLREHRDPNANSPWAWRKH
jgi:hypothetical protein